MVKMYVKLLLDEFWKSHRMGMHNGKYAHHGTKWVSDRAKTAHGWVLTNVLGQPELLQEAEKHDDRKLGAQNIDDHLIGVNSFDDKRVFIVDTSEKHYSNNVAQLFSQSSWLENSSCNVPHINPASVRWGNETGFHDHEQTRLLAHLRVHKN